MHGFWFLSTVTAKAQSCWKNYRHIEVFYLCDHKESTQSNTEKQQVIVGRRMTAWIDTKVRQAGWSNYSKSLAGVFFAEDALPVADALGTSI